MAPPSSTAVQKATHTDDEVSLPVHASASACSTSRGTVSHSSASRTVGGKRPASLLSTPVFYWKSTHSAHARADVCHCLTPWMLCSLFALGFFRHKLEIGGPLVAPTLLRCASMLRMAAGNDNPTVATLFNSPTVIT